MADIKNSYKFDYRDEIGFEYDENDIDDGYFYHGDPKIAKECLSVLINQLLKYEEVRSKLENQDGKIEDLTLINSILTEKITFRPRYHTYNVSLIDQDSIRQLMFALDNYHLDVRRLEHGLPVYYICRKKHNYRGNYDMIVEDIYRSRGYDFEDNRFVKLMSSGKEVYFLRLSHLRKKLCNNDYTDLENHSIDSVIKSLGRNIFQYAWHEDQILGFTTARKLGIRNFQDAIELLYLCLNSELCELRSKVNDKLLKQLMIVYPQKAIYDFVKMITKMEGSKLDKLPNKALKQYARLSKAYNSLLKTEVLWGKGKQFIPLYKIIFGNFFRMNMVGKKLRHNKILIAAKKEFENISKDVIAKILES
ncbi:MAG: hypothetical protein RAO94_12950 [Candidatus Stygibacter australis]|nr:hypothetical protein [Candidatus Stygibacter australis]MDP8323249.1 hypothetical protein [Candidatus Stygibacter australis]